MEKSVNDKYPGRTVRRDGDKIIVSIPVRFRRRNGHQMIVNNGDGHSGEADTENHALIAALAKAYQWQGQLESGEFATIEDLARENRVDVSYVRRTLRLNSLAPRLVEGILAGNEPNGLSLQTLHRGIPLDWATQIQQWS